MWEKIDAEEYKKHVKETNFFKIYYNNQEKLVELTGKDICQLTPFRIN